MVSELSENLIGLNLIQLSNKSLSQLSRLIRQRERERERALLYCIWMKLVLAIGIKHSEIIK